MVPIKLLFIFDNMELSGAHRVALNLMNATSDAGLSCKALICMNDQIGLADQDPRILWPNRRFGESASLLTKMLKALAALHQAIRLAREADIVIGVCPPSTMVAWWAGLATGTPVIGWVHYDVEGRRREPIGATCGRLRDWLQNRLYFNFMPRLRYLAFVSKATATGMARDRHIETLPEGWRSLPNIFKPATFVDDPIALAQLLEIKKTTGEPIILFMGRLARQKRWADTIQAALELDTLGVRAQWIFLGDGPERTEFQDVLAASPVRGRLHWLGSDPDSQPVLAQADALVLTSLYEAWPTVLLEAFDLGVPVVAYDCPSGPAEMLGQQERGWLTQENPRALALALAERLSPSGANEAKRRCQRGYHFLENHRPKHAISMWLDYFKFVISSR